jgi:hypothetical protein
MAPFNVQLRVSFHANRTIPHLLVDRTSWDKRREYLVLELLRVYRVLIGATVIDYERSHLKATAQAFDMYIWTCSCSRSLRSPFPAGKQSAR